MLSRRVDHFVESVIRDMTRLSIKYDAINLAQGFPDSYYKELASMYDLKRKLLYNALKKAGFRCSLPDGAYYITADIPDGIGMDDMAFARYLVSEVGVAAVPGSSFFKSEAGRQKLRFTFSKKEETLTEAARRLEGLKLR